MTTIAAAVFDAIESQRGGPCTTDEVCDIVTAYDRASVISAMHRLSEMRILTVKRIVGTGIVYSLTPGAVRPEDRRGRPRQP